MKKLIIVRHAKSSWEYDISDKDRPLMPKGIRRAQQHARLLKNKITEIPALWISSYATRALHTAVIFSNEFNKIDGLKIAHDLYTFSSKELEKVVREFSDEYESAIIFGHNPASHELVSKLSGEQITDFKTASVACIEFEQNQWNDLANGELKFIISKGKLQ